MHALNKCPFCGGYANIIEMYDNYTEPKNHM